MAECCCSGAGLSSAGSGSLCLSSAVVMTGDGGEGEGEGEGEDEGGCGRRVISTSCSWGAAMVDVAGEAGLEEDLGQRAVFPQSRRGRLRVKLASASSTGSRRGGEAGRWIADEEASAAAGRRTSWPGEVMTVREGLMAAVLFIDSYFQREHQAWRVVWWLHAHTHAQGGQGR